MHISRTWATPIVIGCFVLMAVTGILMFFHLERGLNKTAHEWVGLILVAGVVAHAFANGSAFKGHVLRSRLAQGIIVALLLVLVGSFIKWPSSEPKSAQALVMQSVLRSPLSALAPLTGNSPEQMLAKLQAAQVPLRSADQSLESVIGKDREMRNRALSALFQP
jgi:hypothetical protein